LSELLAETAPLEDSAVMAPDDSGAVESDSGEGLGKHVPAERFNGLMSKFNKTQGELDAERQYRLQLEERLNQIEAANIDINPKENTVTDVTNLQSQVEMLTNLLAKQQVESVRRDVLTEFPDIAPFVDLIEAPDPESFRSLASTLNERVQVLKISDGATPLCQATLLKRLTRLVPCLPNPKLMCLSLVAGLVRWHRQRGPRTALLRLFAIVISGRLCERRRNKRLRN